MFYSQSLKNFVKDEAVVDAISKFDLMLDIRSWNASHGGVYVKEHADLKANPYLQNNTIKSDQNETLIKINPAWMTRQLSEISNQRKNYYFHITSLKPLNPKNSPDEFEKEALKYFEMNQDQSYYYYFKNTNNDIMQLDFMGALKTKKACLSCHADAGYKEGDMRGGIRISIPMLQYNNKLATQNKITIFLILSVSIIVLIVLIILKKYNQESMTRIKRDKALLIKSKQASMTEIVTMLAHQWRQPLATIHMDINNIKVDLELESLDPKELLNTIDNMSNTIEELSNVIDTFSELFHTDTKQKVLKLLDIQEELCNIIEHSAEFKNIEIEKDWQSKRTTLIYKNDFMKACYMILKNSQEAFLENKTKNPKIISKTWDEGESIHYTICDNGGGIDDKFIAKVFEPYFSTKSYNDRGLGLTIVKSIIVDKHKGTINIENNDVGVYVHITLFVMEEIAKE